MSVDKSIINEYLKAGKNLTTLNGKKPIEDDWTSIRLPASVIRSHKGNIGWVLGEEDFVIDVDVKRKDGMKSLEKLWKDIGEKYEPTVVTPSGGLHIYFRIPEELQGSRLRRKLERQYPSIDFLSKGAQCLIPTCSTDQGTYSWFDKDFGCLYQSPLPRAIFELVSYQVAGESELGDFDGLIGGDSSNWSEEKVQLLLDKLDPSMGNDEWVKVGMALQDWDPVRGLELWEQWSQFGDNYTEGETKKRWRSFRVGDGVTLGTIAYMAKEADYDRIDREVQKYVDRIKVSDERAIEFDLIPKIKEEMLSHLHREIVVKAIQDRFKELTGVRMPIGNIRAMAMSKELMAGELVSEERVPEWCKDWVYVNSHSGFVQLDTLRLHKSESFNVENGKYVPMSEGGTKPSATKFVSDRGFVKKVDSIAYLPTIKERICNLDGSLILNSFNDLTVPLEAAKYTEEGTNAIKLVKKHIEFICGNKDDASIFTQWIAHQVQYPGRQVLWSPIIQSIQGVGKSFFGELLRSCLGDRNVGTVSPTQVTSDFNGWATGVVVNVLEELRVKGHNRFDAVNALKPLITDRMIQINDKGIKQFMTYNTANYICFTNYRDSLPLDNDDRRWWVIFVPIKSLDDMKLYVGEEAVTYFPRLFEAVRLHGAEIRKWLLEYEISEQFMNTKQAPVTAHKLSMIATEEASLEGFSEVRELIEAGGEYFNEDCIDSSALFEQFMFAYPEIDVTNRSKHTILKKLGYSSIPKPVKIDGKARRIWTRKPMSNSEIRDSFSEFL